MADDSSVLHERELREQLERLHLDMHHADEKARDLAATDINRRLEGMNELRAQITSERGLYLSRELFDREHAQLRESLDTRLKVLETSRSNLDGRMWAIGAAITFVVSLVVVAINLFFRR